MTEKAPEILLVEDNPADVRLAREAFKNSQVQSVLNVVKDGMEAMSFLRQEGNYSEAGTPDLILLDLNLPRKDGREVLAEIKGDAGLKRIPVVIFTTSRAERDIGTCYDLNANCYIVKPADLDEYFRAIRTTQEFWLTTVTRPPS
jgi:chemotaxis family two-component system response regulator Rcp1